MSALPATGLTMEHSEENEYKGGDDGSQLGSDNAGGG
jgi:hypothetical protein